MQVVPLNHEAAVWPGRGVDASIHPGAARSEGGINVIPERRQQRTGRGPGRNRDVGECARRALERDVAVGGDAHRGVRAAVEGEAKGQFHAGAGIDNVMQRGDLVTGLGDVRPTKGRGWECGGNKAARVVLVTTRIRARGWIRAWPAAASGWRRSGGNRRRADQELVGCTVPVVDQVVARWWAGVEVVVVV